jgi:uncharacterized protein YdeI (YjbR/CyaY-like superfamily)
LARRSQVRFTNVREIVEIEPILKAYIYEAVEVEKAGLEGSYKRLQNSKFLKNFKIIKRNPCLENCL